MTHWNNKIMYLGVTNDLKEGSLNTKTNWSKVSPKKMCVSWFILEKRVTLRKESPEKKKLRNSEGKKRMLWFKN